MPVTTCPQRPGQPPDSEEVQSAFQQLCEVIATLRSPEGCPWDREQTLASIKPYTLEETYELLEAIDADDDDAICEELGDVLLQVVLDSQIAADEGRFDIVDVVRQVTEKMIRRHPHVFDVAEAQTAEDVHVHWERVKKEEKQNRTSLLEGIPATLPSLARAARLTKRAARAGYDFPDRRMLFDKLDEEIRELRAELQLAGDLTEVKADVSIDVVADVPIPDRQRRQRVQDEIGDILFVVANIARRWGINPEEALRRSNQKFIRRFQGIEAGVREEGRSLTELTLPEMEAHYQATKAREAK